MGSRDAKWIKFKNGKFSDMDWNTSCASSTGATEEMLLKFYDIDISEYYQIEDRRKFDFSISDRKKIDVKTTTKPERIHHFLQMQ